MRVYKNLSVNKINDVENGDYIVKTKKIDRSIEPGTIRNTGFGYNKLFIAMEIVACAVMIYCVGLL